MKRTRCRFYNQIVETTNDNNTFSIVFIDTQVKLWKVSKVWHQTRLDLEFTPEEVDRTMFKVAYIKEGEMTSDELKELTASHPRTTFKMFEIKSPTVSHVYSVAYAHKDRMRQYGFLRKDPDDKWYYLIPKEMTDEEIDKILSDSADLNKRRGKRW